MIKVSKKTKKLDLISLDENQENDHKEIINLEVKFILNCLYKGYSLDSIMKTLNTTTKLALDDVRKLLVN